MLAAAERAVRTTAVGSLMMCMQSCPASCCRAAAQQPGQTGKETRRARAPCACLARCVCGNVTGPGLRYYHKQIPTSRTYPPRGPLAHPVHTGALVGAGVGGLGVGEVRVCVHTQRDTR
jgi:hypothetical protein